MKSWSVPSMRFLVLIVPLVLISFGYFLIPFNKLINSTESSTLNKTILSSSIKYVLQYEPDLNDYNTIGINDAEFSGPGLDNASVGVSTYIAIKLPKWDPVYKAVYATFEGADAVFGAFPIVRSTYQDIYLLNFTITVPGIYCLTIDIISGDFSSDWTGGFFPIISHRGVKVHVSGINNVPVSETKRCSSLPWEGVWYKCSSNLLPKESKCLREGYMFKPHDCYYESWNSIDLHSLSKASKKFWIVIIGSSVVRGVFLMMLDHFIGDRDFNMWPLHKCWGRMDVTIGNIKLTYQDLRYFAFANDYDYDHIECHGSREAIDVLELRKNTTNFMKQLFSEKFPPTSIVVDFDQLKLLDSTLYSKVLSIPSTWLGNLIFVYLRSMVSVNKPGDLGGRSPYNPRVSDKELRKFAATFNRHVHFIDSVDITLPFHRFTEMRLQHASQHWHRPTDTVHKNGIPLSKENYPKNWRVAGIVIDMIAQMIFNLEFGHNSFSEKNVLESSDISDVEISFCLDCPLSFIPFHIFHQPQFTCFESMQFDYEHRSRFESPVCPCNNSSPIVGYIKTMSGDVPVRNCQKNYTGV